MPYRMDLIDLGVQGVIGGVIAGATGNDPLHPLYFTYVNDYSGAFFTQATLK